MAERRVPGSESEGAEQTGPGRRSQAETDTHRAIGTAGRPATAVARHPVLALQRSAGNAAVASMLAARRPAAPATARTGTLEAVPAAGEQEAGPAVDHLLGAELTAVGGAGAAPPGAEPEAGPDAGTGHGTPRVT